ncbi:Uncharacterized protein Fot_02555 [Forsythia ovata]|uniref:Uncharacterized protein n=1 Tax=Forsythia ovata TaxID=205694 RepID=A0ABD1X779_9LAMI
MPRGLISSSAEQPFIHDRRKILLRHPSLGLRLLKLHLRRWLLSHRLRGFVINEPTSRSLSQPTLQEVVGKGKGLVEARLPLPRPQVSTKSGASSSSTSEQRGLQG